MIETNLEQIFINQAVHASEQVLFYTRTSPLSRQLLPKHLGIEGLKPDTLLFHTWRITVKERPETIRAIIALKEVVNA